MISLIGGELYQWDTGRIVRIDHDENVTVHEVHFTNKRMDHAYVLKTYIEDDVTYCKIPNIILQQSYRILCYEVCENSDGEETIANTNFDVIKRNKPEDYVYTEQEHVTVVALENRLTKLEESAHTHKNKDALDSIANKNIEAWNSNAEIAHTHENKEQLDTITEADLETWRNLKTKTFYVDFEIDDDKNVTTKITPDEIVAAYKNGQNVVARVLSGLIIGGFSPLLKLYIIRPSDKFIIFADIVNKPDTYIPGRAVVIEYLPSIAKKWNFYIGPILADRKYTDENYVNAYWDEDDAGKFLGIDKTGAVIPMNSPTGDSKDAVTYTEQTLTDDQKARARNNIGALATSDILEVHFTVTTSGLTTTWTADKTYAEIKSALEANKTVIGSNGSIQFGTVYSDSVAIYFTRVNSLGETFTVQISERNTISRFTENIKSLFIRNASVGQIAKIKTVDDNGAPTSWEPVNLPTVPTKTSQLTNDSGYLTEHQSLEAYAKKNEIPTVPTKVSAFENDSGYLTEHQNLDAYAKKTEIPTVPTKTSQLTNDSGYLTEHQSLEAYAKKTEIPSVPTTDSELSATSTNPVQNKIIKAELDKKLDSIPVDGITIKLNDQGQLTMALSNANGVSF